MHCTKHRSVSKCAGCTFLQQLEVVNKGIGCLRIPVVPNFIHHIDQYRRFHVNIHPTKPVVGHDGYELSHPALGWNGDSGVALPPFEDYGLEGVVRRGLAALARLEG